MKLTKTLIDEMRYQFGPDSSKTDMRQDDQIPNLYVRVYPSGKKSFILRKKKNGRDQYLTLGRYGEITLFQARETAIKKLSEINSGKNHTAERRNIAQIPLFEEFATQYLELYAKPKKKSWREDEKQLQSRIIPFFGKKKINQIKRINVVDFHVEVGVKEGFRTHANRMISTLSKMFECAKDWGVLERSFDNPARGIDHFPEVERDRFLSKKELAGVLSGIKNIKNIYVRALLWCFLLTALRKNNLLTLRWDEVDLERGEIKLKKERMKSGRPHTLPIPKIAIDIFRRLPKQLGNPYVFCGKRACSHLVDIHKIWDSIKLKAKVTDCRLHDLRTTVASYLAEEGANPYLIGEILDDKDLKTIRKYARFSRDHARDALEKHSKKLRPFIDLKTIARI